LTRGQGWHVKDYIPLSGARFGEIRAKPLAKIEELTLYMIREHDRVTALEKQNRELLDEIRTQPGR